jgi:hypothetical protein
MAPGRITGERNYIRGNGVRVVGVGFLLSIRDFGIELQNG